jgi:type IV pilus assembly protein PilC
MEFVVKYAKPSGEVLETVQIGQTEDEVRHHLQEQGMLPISVQTRGVSFFHKRERQKPINPDHFIVFNQQFVSLLTAGLPILRALDLLKAQIKNPILKRHIIDVRDRVHSGAMLSDALKAQMVFPTVYTASIYAGSAAATAEVITRYTGYQKTVLKAIPDVAHLSGIPCGSLYCHGDGDPHTSFPSLRNSIGLGFRTADNTDADLYLDALKANLIFISRSCWGLLALVWIGDCRTTMAGPVEIESPIVGNLWTMFSMAQLSRTSPHFSPAERRY